MNETVKYTVHAIHDLAGAVWFGGNVFGIAALNPAVRQARFHSDRGAVTNQAWENFTPLGITSALTLGASWAAIRLSDPRLASPQSQDLARLRDWLVAGTLATTVVGGVLNRVIAESVPADRTPMEDGLTPAPETPAAAAKAQLAMRGIAVANILLGGAVIATGAMLEQQLMDRGLDFGKVLYFGRSPAGRLAGAATNVAKNAAALELVRRGGKLLAESLGRREPEPEPQGRFQQIGAGARALWRERVLRAA